MKNAIYIGPSFRDSNKMFNETGKGFLGFGITGKFHPIVHQFWGVSENGYFYPDDPNLFNGLGVRVGQEDVYFPR